MTDQELVDAVESLAIDPAAFDHETHIRFAWALLRDDPDGARERISSGIRRLAAHAGAPKKYDEALTLNWISRISEHLRPDEDWPGFRRRAEDLFARSRTTTVASARGSDARSFRSLSARRTFESAPP